MCLCKRLSLYVNSKFICTTAMDAATPCRGKQAAEMQLQLQVLCIARFYLEICPSSSRSCAVKVCPICKCDAPRRAVLCSAFLCSAVLCCAAPGLTCPHKSQLHKPISHLLAQNAAHCGASAETETQTEHGQQLDCEAGAEVEIMQTFGALSTQLAGNRNRNRRWATQQKQQQQQQQ